MAPLRFKPGQAAAKGRHDVATVAPCVPFQQHTRWLLLLSPMATCNATSLRWASRQAGGVLDDLRVGASVGTWFRPFISMDACDLASRERRSAL